MIWRVREEDGRGRDKWRITCKSDVGDELSKTKVKSANAVISRELIREILALKNLPLYFLLCLLLFFSFYTNQICVR